MTDPTFTPEADRELLAVYETEELAQQARDLLVQAGVPEREVHIADAPDVVSALRAEMHDELANAFVVPNAAALYPKEGAMGLAVIAVLGMLLGLAIAFPLALIEMDQSYWTRWAVFAGVGVTFGITVAVVAGPSLTTRRPGAKNAAERGVVLRVEHDSESLRRLLADLHPIRLDEIAHDGMPIDTVAHEGPSSVPEQLGKAAHDIAINVQGDDYRPAEPAQ